MRRWAAVAALSFFFVSTISFHMVDGLKEEAARGGWLRSRYESFRVTDWRNEPANSGPHQARLRAACCGQDYCKDCNDKSGNRSDGGIIRVDESASTLQADGPSLRNRQNDIGRTFYILLVAGVLSFVEIGRAHV